MSTPTSQKPHWFMRHKVLTTFVALLLVGVVLDRLRNQTKTNEVSSKKATTRSAKAATGEDTKPTQRRSGNVPPQLPKTRAPGRESPSAALTDLPPIRTATATPTPRPGANANWFIRHKVLTTLLALLLAGVVLDNSGNQTRTNEVSSKKATTRSAKAATGEDTKPTQRRSDNVPPQLPKTRAPRRESPSTAPVPGNRHARRYRVTYVVDGDTIELANGAHVRLAGIDTPELGECGHEAATANMERLVLDRRVGLKVAVENRDHDGRLLRYVNIGKMDAGLRQIKAGLAIARYGSRNGYGHHARENRYIAADNAAPNKACPRQAGKPGRRRTEPWYGPVRPFSTW